MVVSLATPNILEFGEFLTQILFDYEDNKPPKKDSYCEGFADPGASPRTSAFSLETHRAIHQSIETGTNLGKKRLQIETFCLQAACLEKRGTWASVAQRKYPYIFHKENFTKDTTNAQERNTGALPLFAPHNTNS